jgi:hypothetical protein
MNPLYQVTRGRLTSDELVALTVVLMARAGARTGTAAPARHRPGPRWRRLGPAGGYLSPVSWR